MNYLSSKAVIVTGASSGIGAATAKSLAAQGARVVLAARNEERLRALVDDITDLGGIAAYRVSDVTDRADAAALAQFTKDTYGRIDILVNNAGLMLFSYWSDLAVNDWEAMIDTNIKGYLYSIAGVLPFMIAQGGGQILNMDSVAGHQVDPAAGIYSATKFFVQAMTESMRKDLGLNHNVRVNTVSPGVIDTGWADKVNDPEGRKAAQKLNEIAIASADVADAVTYALNQPEHITINDLIISPTKQNW
ncbi:MAG: SDR family oxidoreductase [Microbacterium sp.]